MLYDPILSPGTTTHNYQFRGKVTKKKGNMQVFFQKSFRKMHTLAKTAYFQPSNAQFLKNFTVFGKNIWKYQKNVVTLSPLFINKDKGYNA